MYSDARRSFFLPIRLPVQLRWALLGWLVAEFLVFLALVRVVGLGGTILLGLLTTTVGIVQLRRIGLDAVRGLRTNLEGAPPPGGALLDGLLSALGALLLIVPGFIANLVGLAMAAPSARREVARRFGSGGPDPRQVRRPSAPDVIDLGPEDWRPVDRL